jgi:hypothetical protein
MRRRDALRMLAASTGAVAGGSLIVSAPAHADVGSEPCLFAFTGSPGVTISGFNTQIIGDFITLTVGTISGTCNCGGTPTIQYAFHLVTPLTTATTGGWVTTNQVSLSFVNLWPSAGGAFTVSVGVRVTCAGPTGTTIRCRYASATFTMPASFGQVNTSFSLSTNNGNSAFPNLPACDAAAPRAAALRNDTAVMVAGAAASPPELQALIDGAPEVPPIDVLAEPPQPVEAAPPDEQDDATITTPPERISEPTPSITTTTIPDPVPDSTTTSTPAETPAGD